MKRALVSSLQVTLAALLSAAQQSCVGQGGRGTDFSVRLGPVGLPANASHEGIEQLGLRTWRMPSGGWLRGYRVEVVDSAGNQLPPALLHHAEMVDLERRDLLRPALNRVVSAGKETARLMLPPGMGYPVRAGQELGVNAMLANPTATAYPAAYVRITLRVIPTTAAAWSVLGFYAETRNEHDSTSGDSSFDLPPGRSEKVVEFRVPVGGTILGVGGHIHDYGSRLVVVRAGRGDTLYSAAPRTDSTGAVLGMPTKLFFRGKRVAPGDRFVMTVSYDNTSGHALPGAGMGTFGAVFVPDDLASWPRLDSTDAGVQRDLAGLRSTHQHGMMQGMHH